MDPIQLKLDCDVKYYSNFINKSDADNLYAFIIDNCDLTRKKVTTKNNEGDEINYTLNRGTCMFLDESLKDSDIIPNIWVINLKNFNLKNLFINFVRVMIQTNTCGMD